MSLRKRVGQYLPSGFQRLPVDLAAVLFVTAITVLSVSLPLVRDTPLRAIVSVPFLLFVPGYAFVAALFPEVSDTEDDSVTVSRHTLSDIERLAYSLGSSVALVPLVGFTLNFTPWGLWLEPMLAAFSIFTLICIVIAAKRRSDLPPEERFVVPTSEWYEAIRTDFLSHETQTDKILNGALIVVVFLAAISVGYAFVDAQRGEQYSELYLLSQNSDDSLSADNYPREFTATESQSIVVGITNQEGEQTRYTVVTELQRVQSDNGSITVLERERLDEFTATLDSSDSTQQTRVLAPSIVGERLRLQFLLYRGEPPANPRIDNAYRSTHLWVNVSASDR